MRNSRLNRRTFLGRTAAAFSLGCSLQAARSSTLRIGVTDWNLHLDADPTALPKAAELGFEGGCAPNGRSRPAEQFRQVFQPPEITMEYWLPKFENPARQYGITMGQAATRQANISELQQTTVVLRVQSLTA